MIKKLLIILVLLLTIFSGYIRWSQTKDYQFPLTYDQSRDLLDIRMPGTFKSIPVIGPTTSINGLFLGPGYYIFNLPAFWIGGGNPQTVVNWNIICFLFSGILIFLFFLKRDIVLGSLITTIYLFSPQLFDTTRYFWNAHSMIYVMVLYFLSLIMFSIRKSTKFALILGISAGFSMQFEAAMGIVAVLFSFIYVIFKTKNIKIFLFFLFGLVPWFFPQIAVELFKGFKMTRLLFGEIVNPTMLGEKLTILKTFQSHMQTFDKYWEGQFILNFGLGKILLYISIILGIINKKYRKTVILLLSFELFTFVFYLITYRHELKIWYAESLRVWYIFMIGFGTVSLINLANKYSSLKKIVLIIIFVFVSRNVYLTYLDQKQFINNINFAKDDPKLTSHLIETVDWVYQKTNGAGFKAYNYVPEIYDYPYQYIYWWKGNKKFNYVPGEVSYEPNVPQYIPRQYQFYENAKNSETLIALIYERKSNYLGWLNKYANYCVKESQIFDWNVTAEIREKCVK